MAIKPCSECGGPVSDKAEICPRCGAKPPKKMGIWATICVVMLCLAVLIWVFSYTTPSTSSQSNVTNQQSIVNTEPVVEEPQNWVYNSSKDEMRGTESYYAKTLSLNSVDFDFPYNGGSKLLLTVRKNNEGNDVILRISKGQILCGLDGCDVAFKFDDGSVQSISMVEPDNHSSEVLFVRYDNTEEKIINHLKNSKNLVVEVPFYQEGRKQFTFDVSNLNWKH